MAARTLSDFLRERRALVIVRARGANLVGECTVGDTPPIMGKPRVYAKPRKGTYSPFALENAARGVGWGQVTKDELRG